MLSLTCKAAIKAVIFLASRPNDLPRAGFLEIAGHIGENEHTVGKLLQRLVKSGIINSAKGPHGGFYLDGNQMTQRIIRVIHTIDGSDVFNQCGLGLSQCSDSQPCPMHDEFKSIRDSFEQLCWQKTIIQLCSPVAEGVAFLIN